MKQSPCSRASVRAPLQIDELTPAVCFAYRCQLEHALKAMQMLLSPADYAEGRGKPAWVLISERRDQGLDPYLPAYALDKIKAACRNISVNQCSSVVKKNGAPA